MRITPPLFQVLPTPAAARTRDLVADADRTRTPAIHTLHGEVLRGARDGSTAYTQRARFAHDTSPGDTTGYASYAQRAAATYRAQAEQERREYVSRSLGVDYYV